MKRSAFILFILMAGFLAMAARASGLMPQLKPFLPIHSSVLRSITRQPLPALPPLPAISGKITLDAELAALYNSQA